MRNEKGQGALEYLLLIGGAVLVAAIVIVLLLGINSQSNTQTINTTANALCNTKTASTFQSNSTAFCSSTGLSGGVAFAAFSVSGKSCVCTNTTQLPNCQAVCT